MIKIIQIIGKQNNFGRNCMWASKMEPELVCSLQKLFKWSQATGFFPFEITSTTTEFSSTRYLIGVIVAIILLVDILLASKIFLSLNLLNILIMGFPNLAFLSIILLTLTANFNQFYKIKNAFRHIRKILKYQATHNICRLRSTKSGMINYLYLCVGIVEFGMNEIFLGGKPHLTARFRLLPLFFVSMSILNQFYGLLELLQSCLVNLNKILRATQPVRANKKLLTDLTDGYDDVIFAAKAICDFYSFR